MTFNDSRELEAGRGVEVASGNSSLEVRNKGPGGKVREGYTR